jgi:hypothetical protein
MWALLAPSAAWACPVCGGSGLNNSAYMDSTIFLSLIPLAMLGAVFGAVWWIAKTSAAADAEAEAHREAGRAAARQSS